MKIFEDDSFTNWHQSFGKEISLFSFLTLAPKAQEEMAWKIAKMIVNDVVHQGSQDSPVKSTKV